MAADERLVTLLGQLDISAAFDTFDHFMLLGHLWADVVCVIHYLTGCGHFGLTERSRLPILSSNICCAAGAVWDPVRIRTGPTAVSSPCVYTAELGHVVARGGLNLHQYADDMQIYVNTSARDAEPL